MTETGCRSSGQTASGFPGTGLAECLHCSESFRPNSVAVGSYFGGSGKSAECRADVQHWHHWARRTTTQGWRANHFSYGVSIVC